MMNMIKKFTINKFVVTTLSLTLLIMFYFFPSNKDFNTEVIVNEENKDEQIVYLLDKDNYVAKVITYFDSETIIKTIKNKIMVLINGDENLNNFYSLIPKNTVLLSVEVKEENVYLNFSKAILEVNKYLEEEMVESIVYSLTEINGINNIYIKVEGEELTKLPHSKKELSYPLTRNYGINKRYDLINLNDITKTTVVFAKEVDDYLYYVPVTKVSNAASSKIDIIIEELKSLVNAQDNLCSLPSGLILEDYDEMDNKMNLVFNDYIFNDSSSKVILEEVKYTISKSIFENYNVKEVIFNTKEHKNIASVNKN